jgi:hypothetical protein
MLDQDLKQAYKKITPSPDLKHKILALQAEPQRRKGAVVLRMKPIATIAACMVLLLGGVLLTSRMYHLGQSDILLQGDIALNEQAIAFVPQTVEYTAGVSPRVASVAPASHTEETTAGVAIDLYVDPRELMEVTVEQGSLSVGSELQGEAIFEPVGQIVSVSKEYGVTLIRWVIPKSDVDGEYRMYIGDDVICVTYRTSTNEYLISRTDAES